MTPNHSLTRFHPADGACSPVVLLHTRRGPEWHTYVRERGLVPTFTVYRGNPDFNEVVLYERGQYGRL